MTEWLYKATETKVTFEETRDLAQKRGFLCSRAHKATGALNTNTKNVEFKDLLHVYHVGADGAEVVGTFEVSSPRHHPEPELFGGTVHRTTLRMVKDPKFADELRNLGTGSGEGYAEDQTEGCFTGWTLNPLPEVATPTFISECFPGQQVLVKRP